jgi:archaellum component FlaC
MVTYQAGKLVVEEEGFDDLLDETRDRVDEIEGELPPFARQAQ